MYTYLYIYVYKEWFIEACQVLRLSSGQTCERFSSKIHFADMGIAGVMFFFARLQVLCLFLYLCTIGVAQLHFASP